jgi:hypothetical protein
VSDMYKYKVEVYYAAFEPVPTHVARFDIEAEDIEDALDKVFVYTQNIENAWVDEGRHTWISPNVGGKLRSMSVGDYMQITGSSTAAYGVFDQIFQVVPVGFTQVPSMQKVDKRAGSTIIDRNIV